MRPQCWSLEATLRPRFATLLDKARGLTGRYASLPAARDIGALINGRLTENIRAMSMRASIRYLVGLTELIS